MRVRLIALSFWMTSWAASAHSDPELAGYVDVVGGQIWYRLNGRQHIGKKPALIAINGGPGGSHRGNMVLVELASDRPVVLYDQLDTGHSTRTGEPQYWTIDRFISEIDALRKALALNDVIVIGHSWGGTLAAEYGVRNPAGLKAAVLSSPMLSTRQWIEDTSRLIDELPTDSRETIRKHLASGNLAAPEFRAAEQVFTARHVCRPPRCPSGSYGVDGPPFNVDVYRYMWGPTEFHASGTLRHYDLSPRLREIRVPTLIVCGEFDEARPESCARFAGMISGARAVVIQDASHSTYLEQKESYLGAIRRFLREAGL